MSVSPEKADRRRGRWLLALNLFVVAGGFSALIYGLYAIYPPVAYIVGGICGIILAVKR